MQENSSRFPSTRPVVTTDSIRVSWPSAYQSLYRRTRPPTHPGARAGSSLSTDGAGRKRVKTADLTIGGGIGAHNDYEPYSRRAFDAHVYESEVRMQPVGNAQWYRTNAHPGAANGSLSDCRLPMRRPTRSGSKSTQTCGILLRSTLQVKVKVPATPHLRTPVRHLYEGTSLEHMQPGTFHLDKALASVSPRQQQRHRPVRRDAVEGRCGSSPLMRIHSVVPTGVVRQTLALAPQRQTCYSPGLLPRWNFRPL